MPLPERELIAKIRRASTGRSRHVLEGIGDDCAVLRPPPGHELLITTDFSLEDVHFRRAWFSPDSVGHRCATRGLSDIAAMGGEPLAAFLSLALPADLEQSWVDGFMAGFTRLLRTEKMPLAGGDTAQSPSFSSSRANSKGKILADVVMLGSVPRGNAVLRSGAKVGDDIYVTGDLGAPVAGLNQLRASGMNPRQCRVQQGIMKSASAEFASSAASRIASKLFFPKPRTAVGRHLRERSLVSAMIDVSDGLSTDLMHICEASKVGAWIAAPAVPVARGATLDDALHGGDEYELLFTAPAAKHNRVPNRIAGVPIRWLGTITQEQGLWLVDRGMKQRRHFEPRGWEHFRG